MSRPQRFIARAVSQAMLSECRWRHGAAITKGSVVMATSPNLFRNRPEIDFSNATFHAEEAVIRELFRQTGWTYSEPRDLSEYTLYVARIDARNMPALSRPCESCWQMILHFNIQDVYYTNELGALSHESIIW